MLNNNFNQSATALNTSLTRLKSLLSPRFLFVVMGVLLIIVAVGSGYFLFGAKIKGFFNPVALKVGSTEFRQSDVQRHDKALVGYYKNTGSITEAQIKEIAAGREKVVKFANENGITVSDSEVQSLKDTLIKETGREKVMADIASYGWSDQDWSQVLWWQILREKILANFEAYREGEVVSVRWDSLSPDPEKIAPQRAPLAKEYLEQVRKKLAGGEIKNLKAVSDTIKTGEITLGENQDRFVFQYKGLDAEGKYFRFRIDPALAGSQYLVNTKIPDLTEVTCTLKGCLFYNIIAGSNGSNANEDVKNFLNGKLLI